MANISTFGCSFTQGVWPVHYSWSKQFAKDHPQHMITDYSNGGTSIKWTAGELLRVCKSAPDDVKVVQITSPIRSTLNYADVDYVSMRWKSTPNFNRYDRMIAHSVLVMNLQGKASTVGQLSKDETDLVFKTWHDSVDPELELLEYGMYIDWIRAHADFVFFHKSHDAYQYHLHSNETLPSVEEHFGLEQFKAWIYDKGHHFGPEGVQEVANWVSTNLNL